MADIAPQAVLNFFSRWLQGPAPCAGRRSGLLGRRGPTWGEIRRSGPL